MSSPTQQTAERRCSGSLPRLGVRVVSAGRAGNTPANLRFLRELWRSRHPNTGLKDREISHLGTAQVLIDLRACALFAAAMPLPDERQGKSVASLIGRFEQQTKKQLSSSPGPRSSSVASQTTGDSAKEEARERREWPPRTSNVTSTPSDSEVGKREWPPRLSTQNSGDSSGQRWPPVQPIIQASPFSELKKSPTSPLAKDSELAAPEVEASPSPPAEIPKVIEVTPPSRQPTLVEYVPPKPVELEPPVRPKTPPQPTITSPTTKPGPSSVATKSPPKTLKATPTKPNARTTGKPPPPSSFTKGTPLHAEVNDRRTSTSSQTPSRPTSRTNLRSKTPTSRPSSSAQRKPGAETPKQTVKRPKTPSTSARHLPSTPNKPPPVIPKTPNSRLYAPTAASLAKSTNSPQPPPPERKKTLSSGVSLERLSKPTASSLSKSRSNHTITSTTSPPKSKLTPTRTGTLITGRKSTVISKPKPASPTSGKNSMKEDGEAHEESHENGNGLVAEVPIDQEALHHDVELSDAEPHHPGPDCQHEHFANGSLEVSWTEEPSEIVNEIRVHNPGGVAHQHYVEDLQEFVHSHSSESGDATSDLHVEDDPVSEPAHERSLDADQGTEQELANDDIAHMVGLLETTSFSSKHILQGSDESVASNSHIPGLEKECQKIGEIPDE
ncbi:hypothetical protein BJ322DRAFT_1113816 [Thelephora terrestris]|uniref:Uncharacterized protein n=1 Tax=Thelephora terrestris TaxID=56493 RepID=A0A9P6L1S6_9AGAM|nr:hypothetical protein BJ322DRAFT_1113816 [Thelephora terrestris]